MVPATAGARLNDVGSEVVAASAEGLHLRCGGHHPPEGRQARTEHVRDEHDLALVADRATDLRGCTEVGGGADELGVGVAHLVLAQPPTPELIDEVTAGKAVVDDGTAQACGPT